MVELILNFPALLYLVVKVKCGCTLMFFSSRHQQSAFLFELPHMVWWSFISFAFQLIYYCAKNSMRESVLSDLRGRISFRFFLLQRIDLECSPNINKLTAHICTTSDGLVTKSLSSVGFFKFWAYFTLLLLENKMELVIL